MYCVYVHPCLYTCTAFTYNTMVLYTACPNYKNVHKMWNFATQRENHMSAAAAGSEEQEEAVLRLAVANVSRLEEVAFSKPTALRNHLWRLMVVHREVNSHAEGKKDVMGAYVQHVGPKTTLQNWSIVVSATITLVNQTDSEKSYSKDFRHQYTRQSTDWGYSTFLRWKEVTNPVKGFIKDDTIVVQARLVYPELDTHGEPSTSSSQSLITSSPSTTSQLQASSQAQSQASSHLQDSEGSQLMPTSTSVLPSEVVTLLVCPRCGERYDTEGKKSPNTLKCGHTFCQDCLLKLVSQGDGAKLELCCSVCGQEHSGSSDSKPWFPNHSMIQLISSVLSKAKHFCPTHQHDLNYYCFEDKCLVCIYCAYHGEHASHQCRHVNEAKQVVREGLRGVRLQVTSRAMEVERRLRLLRDEQEGVRSRAQSAARLVEEFFENIEVVLRRQRDLLLQELKMHTTEVASTLDGHVRELERKQAVCQGVLEEYKRWKSLPAREALLKTPALTQGLQSIISSPKDNLQPLHPALRVSVELPCSDVLTSVGQLGRVTISAAPDSATAGSAVGGKEKEEKEKGQSPRVEGEGAVVNGDGGGGNRSQGEEDSLDGDLFRHSESPPAAKKRKV